MAECKINEIFNTLDNDDPCVRVSKSMISLSEDGHSCKCSLCKTSFDVPLEPTNLRFTIWSHIQEPGHRHNLPNYQKMVSQCDKWIKQLSCSIPDHLKNDLTYLKMGPAFRFLLCTLCYCAVYFNEHFLKTHFQSKCHEQNKNTSDESVKKQIKISSELTFEEHFNNLMMTLPQDLKSDSKYIQKGHIPGYLICTLCSRYIIPTHHLLKSHLEDFWHTENKNKPFLLPDYSRKIPTSVKRVKNNYVSLFCMEVIFSLLRSNDINVRMNSEFIYKQCIFDRFYCQLCDVLLKGTAVDVLIQNIQTHFNQESHKTNVSLTYNFEMMIRFKNNDFDRFPLFLHSTSEEFYRDFKYLHISKSTKEIRCLVCDCSLPLSMLLCVDHIESKQHLKKRNCANSSKEIHKAVSTNEGNATDVQEQNESVLDKMLEKMINLNDGDKNSIRPSKKEGKLKCKTCNIKFAADFETLTKHLGSSQHKTSIKMKTTTEK